MLLAIWPIPNDAHLHTIVITIEAVEKVFLWPVLGLGSDQDNELKMGLLGSQASSSMVSDALKAHFEV